MAIDPELEAEWAAARADCWARFRAAVAAAQGGRNGLAHGLVREIEERCGAETAERARKELKACIAEWKAKK